MRKLCVNPTFVSEVSKAFHSPVIPQPESAYQDKYKTWSLVFNTQVPALPDTDQYSELVEGGLLGRYNYWWRLFLIGRPELSEVSVISLSTQVIGDTKVYVISLGLTD